MTRAGIILFFIGISLIVGATAALAADETSHRQATFFLALLLMMVCGRLLGEAMIRLGQPSVVGQLLAGMLLGPSVLGVLWPDLQHSLFPNTDEQKLMIDAIAQVGVLLLLLLTGMETDLRLIRKVGRAAISVSISGVAVPFICGAALAWFLPDSLLPDSNKRLLTSLFLATALSISSIKIVAAVVREMNFMRRNLGQVIMASAVLEDTIGWVIIAIIFGIAGADQIDLMHIARSVIGVLIFLVASFTIGRRLITLLIRWSNDHLTSEFAVITTILVLMLAMALLTNVLGVHFILGAFISGVLIGESPILTKYIDTQLRGLIVAFFMPVFFAVAGLSADFTILGDPYLLAMTLVLIAVASVGKFLGAFVGAELGGLTRREGLALGCSMNARGATEVIVATIGLSMGALSQDLFTMIVAMALVTTLAMPPMLRMALASLPMGKDEKERLDREEFEAKGFVSNLERLLIAADQSASGKLASRLAGILAGRSGMPTTVLKLASPRANAKNASLPADKNLEQAVKHAAETGETKDESEQAGPVDITVKEATSVQDEVAVFDEAKKGYDLLFIGSDGKTAKKGPLPAKVAPTVSAFEGPSAIVLARGDLAAQPLEAELKILVPITGTKASRQAAELAFSIAQGRQILALYVGSARRSRWRPLHDERQAILKDIVEMADRFNAKVEPIIRTKASPQEGILAEAKNGHFNLIVMGVSPRPGPELFFGDTATAILETSPVSLVFLSTE